MTSVFRATSSSISCATTMGATLDETSLALRRVFTACQEDETSISKSVSRFRKVWDKQGQEDDKARRHFFARFVHYLQLPLAIKERTPYVDRCLEVACRFASSFLKEQQDKDKDKDKNESSAEDEEDLPDLPPFMHWLFEWLLDHHEVEASQARLRICLMLNHLLKLMGEDASIDDDLYQKIFDNMLLRLKDRVADIRSQAVTALQRLQDPRDPACPIIKAFVFHMASDPSPVVRRTVVRVIGATRLTLPHVIRRTKDVDEGVRKAAFKFVAEKIHIKSLTIGQREEILKRGLGDRAEGVRSIMERDLSKTTFEIISVQFAKPLSFFHSPRLAAPVRRQRGPAPVRPGRGQLRGRRQSGRRRPPRPLPRAPLPRAD